MTGVKLHIDVTHVGFVKKTNCTHLANVSEVSCMRYFVLSCNINHTNMSNLMFR